MTTAPPAQPYVPRRAARSEFVGLRGPAEAPLLRAHLQVWDAPAGAPAEAPPILMLHGWMDVAASFQFVVDALRTPRPVIAPDWRGFGDSTVAPTDSFWFPDYLADLDALLDRLSPDRPVDLVAHSMGANVAMLYAGIRPQRVRRLVNLEGFGMPPTRPAQAPGRYARWLDELREAAPLRPYEDLDAVARRLQKNNPRLAADKARWLAAAWSRPAAEGGLELRADPAHRRVNPVLARQEEMLACWSRIAAPVLWVEAAQTRVFEQWGMAEVRPELDARTAVVPRLERVVIDQAGHMLHHDQPQALAALIDQFLAAPEAGPPG